MPIENPNDAAEVESRIARIFAAKSAERSAEIRALFVEVLDFGADSGQVDLGAVPDNVVLPDIGGAHRYLGQRECCVRPPGYPRDRPCAQGRGSRCGQTSLRTNSTATSSWSSPTRRPANSI